MKWFVLSLQIFLPSSQANSLGPTIYKVSSSLGEDPYLVAGVIYIESRLKNGLCYSGAHGLMQIQLSGIRNCDHNSLLRAKWLDLYDPSTNIRSGIRLMKTWRNWCKKHHTNHHWLLHYNQGFGKCPKGRRSCLPRERTPITTGKIGGYAERVLDAANRLRLQQPNAKLVRKTSPEAARQAAHW